MVKGQRLVDLTHDLQPGAEEYGLELDTRFVDDVSPMYKRRADVWYTLQTIHMGSHVGTHIEFPRHFDPRGLDSAAFPLDRLIGPACVLDFRRKGDDEPITLEDVQAYQDVIQNGDIVFLHTGRHRFHNTPTAHRRPYLSADATLWLVEEKNAPVIGVDATGIEVKGTDYHPIHTILLKEHGCALIEAVGDLSQLHGQRFQIWILPLKIHGLDSSPVRIVAVEEEDEPQR